MLEVGNEEEEMSDGKTRALLLPIGESVIFSDYLVKVNIDKFLVFTLLYLETLELVSLIQLREFYKIYLQKQIILQEGQSLSLLILMVNIIRHLRTLVRLINRLKKSHL